MSEIDAAPLRREVALPGRQRPIIGDLISATNKR
jgi:hypothetical protein